jgi:hypothetical protein
LVVPECAFSCSLIVTRVPSPQTASEDIATRKMPSLLKEAVERGFSTDGEVFVVTDLKVRHTLMTFWLFVRPCRHTALNNKS